MNISNIRVPKKLILKKKKKITFKVVQVKFLAMHITNQKFSFYIFTIRNLLNIVMEHYPYVMIKKIKIYNFDPYTGYYICWLLLLMTGFVVTFCNYNVMDFIIYILETLYIHSWMPRRVPSPSSHKHAPKSGSRICHPPPNSQRSLRIKTVNPAR